MTAEWSVPAWVLLVTLGVLTLVLVALAVLVRRAAARAERAERLAHDESEALRAQVDAIERQLAAARTGPSSGARSEPPAPPQEFVITRLGDEDREELVTTPTVDAPLFADLVLREGVVQAASFAVGVRRALSPAHLNRVRYEMRREVKRARKQRRADVRQAKRAYDARDRAGDTAA